jgi:predicted signal transduction protein with EAL and GGDEF domain
VFPHDGATYEALLAAADHLMYRDKASRRGHAPLTDRSAVAGEYVAPTIFDTPLQTAPPPVVLPQILS